MGGDDVLDGGRRRGEPLGAFFKGQAVGLVSADDLSVVEPGAVLALIPFHPGGGLQADGEGGRVEVEAGFGLGGPAAAGKGGAGQRQRAAVGTCLEGDVIHPGRGVPGGVLAEVAAPGLNPIAA